MEKLNFGADGSRYGLQVGDLRAENGESVVVDSVFLGVVAKYFK